MTRTDAICGRAVVNRRLQVWPHGVHFSLARLLPHTLVSRRISRRTSLNDVTTRPEAAPRKQARPCRIEHMDVAIREL